MPLSAITRLINMGVEPYLIGAALNMVLAQRLVRRICPKCREAYEPPRHAAQGARADGLRRSTSSTRASAAASCRNTGYSGRIGVHELLIINDELRDAIVAERSVGRAAPDRRPATA